MARKRRSLPPFEVMGKSKPAPPDVAPVRREPNPEETIDNSYAHAGPAKTHFVLRIPQAYGLLLAAGLIGAVVLAYWLGTYNGRKAGHEAGYDQAQREHEAERQARRRVGSLGSDRPTGVTRTASGAAVKDDPYADNRQPGLNYFVVARYPQKEALAARAFLAEHGVASFLQQDQNTPLYEVIATRGFEKAEVNTETTRRFERELDRLGRLWKQHDKGPSEFDPYLRKH